MTVRVGQGPESVDSHRSLLGAGAIPVGTLFAQAVEDALMDTGLETLEIPLSPSRLRTLAGEARAASTSGDTAG
jgi:hypothetical protein